MDQSSLSVLIVEDEFIIALTLEKILLRLGYQVASTVGSGEEALAFAAATPPDIILMDIMLAGEMDGIETACAIQKSCGVPSIFITGNTDRHTYERALLCNPYSYLEKPIDKARLRSTLAQACKMLGKREPVGAE